MTKMRVMTDWNSTPVCSPNPLWKDDGTQKDPDINGQYHWIRRTPLAEYACTNLGFEKVLMAYDGFLNYAPTYMNPDLTLKNLTYDATRKLYNVEQQFQGNFCNPPQDLQVKMLAALSNIENPFPLDGTKSPRYMPMVFDLENPSVMSDAAGVQNMVGAIKAAKSLKADSEVGAFAWPSHEKTQEVYDRDGWKSFADAADFVCGGNYFWDVPTANPKSWFAEIDMQTKLLDRFYSFMPRWAFFCPLYQEYFPQNDSTWVANMNNKPVDLALWKKALQYCVDRDFHIYIWLGGTPMNTQTQALLQAANAFQL